MAAEARETRRQELLEKIVEGQAAKKQKLERDSGADEGQEASGSEATQGSQTSDDGQASAEQEGAGESSVWSSDLGQEGRKLWGILIEFFLGGIRTPCLVDSVILLYTLPQTRHLPQTLHFPNQGLQMG